MNRSDQYYTSRSSAISSQLKGNRALAAAYLDGRAVMQRLDSVFGGGGWKDAYELVNGGSVVCTLSVKVDGGWVQKTDVGSPSEQPDDRDRLKAAFPDRLKRAACKLGVGRYLYKLPRQWIDYDSQKKPFVKAPTRPAWALPAASNRPETAPRTEKRGVNPSLNRSPMGDGTMGSIARLFGDVGALAESILALASVVMRRHGREV